MAGAAITGRKISLALAIRPHGLFGAFSAPWAMNHTALLDPEIGAPSGIFPELLFQIAEHG
jgi:hypothetical protein